MDSRIEWGEESSDDNEEYARVFEGVDDRIEMGEVEIWTQVDEVTDLGDNPICLVCRQEIDEADTNIHNCSGCQTKYHQNCWREELNGRCVVCSSS